MAARDGLAPPPPSVRMSLTAVDAEGRSAVRTLRASAAVVSHVADELDAALLALRSPHARRVERALKTHSVQAE